MNNWSARQQHYRINRNDKTFFFAMADANRRNRGFNRPTHPNTETET